MLFQVADLAAEYYCSRIGQQEGNRLFFPDLFEYQNKVQYRNNISKDMRSILTTETVVLSQLLYTLMFQLQ